MVFLLVVCGFGGYFVWFADFCVLVTGVLFVFIVCWCLSGGRLLSFLVWCFVVCYLFDDGCLRVDLAIFNSVVIIYFLMLYVLFTVMFGW